MSTNPSANLFTALLSPTPSAILTAVLVVLSLPVLLHIFLFRSQSDSNHQPAILLLGPSGAGKTSLLTLLENHNHAAVTRTSQTPLTVLLSLDPTIVPSSSKYRSARDPTLQAGPKFLLTDYPGHAKLRHHAFSALGGASSHSSKKNNNNNNNNNKITGVIFLVDAADLAPGGEGLRDAAEYLHDVLLCLQRRYEATAGSKKLKRMRDGMFCVLVAANKLDLFTALPATMVKRVLEAEVEKVRVSRKQGLMDSGVGVDDDHDVDDERGWLGGGRQEGGDHFTFKGMEEEGVVVTVVGGNVSEGDGPDVRGWWEWIGELL